MFIRNLLLSTLAVAGIVHAQSSDDDACSAKQNKIESSGDVNKISSCNTLEGDLILGQNLGTLDLPQLQQIKGSFIAENCQDLVSINLGSLRSISKEFRLIQLTSLNTLNCPQLTNVGGIKWITLPKLQKLSFTRKVTEAGSVTISDTSLESLDGIDLRTASIFRVDNCKSLKSVKVGLRNVSEALALEFNGKAVDVQFPELIWAKNITMRDATSVKLPKLVYVNSSMIFQQNHFTSIECDKLEVVKESLAFVGNEKLTNASFPSLTEVGGALMLANNTVWETVDGFPKLETIGGAIDFAGVFKSVSFPSLQDVVGGFHLETSNELDCSPFEKMKGSVIQGDDFTCKSKVAHPESKDGSSSGGGSDDDDTKGAAGRMTLGPALGLSVAAVFLAAF